MSQAVFIYFEDGMAKLTPAEDGMVPEAECSHIAGRYDERGCPLSINSRYDIPEGERQ